MYKMAKMAVAPWAGRGGRSCATAAAAGSQPAAAGCGWATAQSLQGASGAAATPSPLVGAVVPQGSFRAVAQHVHQVLRAPAGLAAAAAASLLLALLLLAPDSLKVHHHPKHARRRPSPAAAAAAGCRRRCCLGCCPSRRGRLLWRQHPNEPPRLEEGEAVLGGRHYCPDLAPQLL